MVTVVTSTAEAGVPQRHDALLEAVTDVRRWLARGENGEWAVILDSKTGAMRRRYRVKRGKVEREE